MFWISTITAYGILALPTTCVTAMTEYPKAAIYNGDLLVVDSAGKILHDDIVEACVLGKFMVKQLLLMQQPMNAAWSPIYPAPDYLDIFGSSRTAFTVSGKCTDVCPA